MNAWAVRQGWVVVAAAADRSVFERFAPQVGHLLISATRNIDAMRRLGEVVEDDTAHVMANASPDVDRGAQRVAARARTDWVAIVPCDAPHLRAPGATPVEPRCIPVRLQRVLACVVDCQPLFAVVKTCKVRNLRQRSRPASAPCIAGSIVNAIT